MLQHIAGALVVISAALTAAHAAPPLSGRPFVYVIDYSDRWVTDPAATERLGPELPDILHIGKAVPVTHNWGPIPYMAGENQDTGGKGHTLNLESIRLLSPQELAAKIEQIEAAVRRLHDAGVPLVLPYICHYTMAGDHESRRGLWAFYDGWGDYERWLGPRPETDPTDWIMRDLQGRRMDPAYGYTPPYFEPLHRYGACPSNPGWNQFSRAIVRLIAECGYDGTFVDNSCHGGDGCDHCRAAFAAWVRDTFGEDDLRRFCGVDEVGPVEFSNKVLAPVVSRWHTVVIRDRLAMLRRSGREVNPEFLIFPNSGGYQRTTVMGDGCDLHMFENTEPPGCLMAGEVPDDPRALIEVRAGAQTSMTQLGYNVVHEEVFSEVTATVGYPEVCPPAEEVGLSLEVLTVGASNLDGDCLQEPTLRLTHLETGATENVALGPEPGVGDPGQMAGARRPPVTLSGTWTPAATGSYAVDLRYLYTDAEHLDVADRVQISDRLGAQDAYRVDLGGLGCTYNARCRTIALVKDVTRKGSERIQELCLAQGAAAGGRFSPHSSGEPRAKYARFFRAYGDLAAGLAPYGSATLLYSYWGPNPGEVGRNNTRSIHEYLSSHHILYRTLLDRDLEASDLAGIGGESLLLVARAYELTGEQLAALRRFIVEGGKVILGEPAATINFRPAAEALGVGADTMAVWDWASPPDLAPRIADTRGRLRGVRFAAFATPSARADKVVLHAVNHNVCLVGEKVGQVTTIEGLSVAVPVPGHWTAASARVFDPDMQAPTELSCTIEGTVARLSLPPLTIYQMIELVGR